MAGTVQRAEHDRDRDRRRGRGRFALGGYATVYDGVVGPWLLELFAKATGLESLE